MKRSEILARLPIAPDDFVVEIGSGPIPYPGTDLILDKFPFANEERSLDIA